MHTNSQKKNKKGEKPKKIRWKKKERRTKPVRINEEKHYKLKVDALWNKLTITELLSRIIDFFYRSKKRDLSNFEAETDESSEEDEVWKKFN